MRPMCALVSATLMAAALARCRYRPSAQASPANFAINGTYAATSDGSYATTNYAFHNESTIKAHGLSPRHALPMRLHRPGEQRPGMERTATHAGGTSGTSNGICRTGKRAPTGAIVYRAPDIEFSAANADGVTQIGSPYLEGKDKTVGPRYACGTYWYGKPLTIVLPFRLDKIG